MLEELQRLGLTPGEAKVYLATLQLGSSTVGPIVKEAGVSSSNIYEILERLMEKGLVTMIMKQKTKHFQAAGATNLRLFVEKKQAQVEEQKALADELVPRINDLSGAVQEEAEVFVGKRGLRSAYDLLLEDANGEDFLFFFSPNLVPHADQFYFEISEWFKDADINLRGISTEDSRDNPGFAQTSHFTEMRYVDFPVPGNMDIFKDKVLLISWEQPIGFLMRSQEVADNLSAYFEAIWKQANP